jgi:hypothetical protein
MKHNFKEYKERPSQAGRIMSNAKGASITEKQLETLNGLIQKEKLTANQEKTKGELIAKRDAPPQLSQGAKTRVDEQFLADAFGINRDFWSKETDKGNECEDESIKLFAKVAGIFGIKKNEQKFENDFFKGTPDIVTDDAVIDIKTSFSGSTFPWFANKLPETNYFYQVQAYLYLTGRQNGFVAYCLTNSNDDQIQDEVRRESWRQKIIDPTDEQLDAIETKVYSQMTFDHIDDALRVKIFEIPRDEDVINKMIERVKLCRGHYEKRKTEILNK